MPSVKVRENEPFEFALRRFKRTCEKAGVLAETRKAADSVISAFRQLDANILVQEYVKEARGADIRAFVVGGKVVAAICHAGWMLVSAGILRGRQATSFFSIKDDLVAAGADWKDAEVVVDGNLITSRKPDDLPAFCRAIVGALSKV